MENEEKNNDDVAVSVGGNGGETVALLGVEVCAEVVAGHACATVRQRYRNDERKPIEAIYTFPLPSKAILTGFSMTVAGRRLEGEVHEREQAFRAYDDAITAGHGSALLEQERPNVFTANVGNLLPGEETTIELQYVEPLIADEGAVRWAIPTLVAPRYVPGIESGDRTAHGTASPTNRVPDADRISPPIGAVSYGLALDLTFDLGVAVDVESPSHAIVVREAAANKTHVTFSQKEVPLDRDIVVTAFAKGTGGVMPIASAVTHRVAGKTGTLALTLVPDLGAALREAKKTGAKAGEHNDVVFVLDRSGSMGGSSMSEARTALRLCLRQLREGDRFDILAFDDRIEPFAGALVPFGQGALQRADAWLSRVDARGGTELLAPMLEAARLAPDGLVIVLTDGQVGNEDEILSAFLEKRKGARVHSFGIGTNVSDALLQALADRTDGTVEMIHPGERLDEKVVAQFARATALRVTEVTIKTRGIELGELAPSEPRPLVDGEPYCVFATYEVAGRGAIEIRGKLGGEPFYVDVAVDLPDVSDRPVVSKLWAQSRIRDFEQAALVGRRAETMKDRIVKLAVEHGVSSKYTSFVVVEKRTGDRRVNEQAETRVVPVAAPTGWAMFKTARSRGPMPHAKARSLSLPSARGFASIDRAVPMGGRAVPMAPSAAPPSKFDRPTGAAPPLAPAPAMAARMDDDAEDAIQTTVDWGRARGLSKPMVDPSDGDLALPSAPSMSRDPILERLGTQAASGMWDEPGRDTAEVTVDVLLQLFRWGITTVHPVYGAQIKKAVDALLERIVTAAVAPRVRELALGVAWLIASGRRTRQTIESAARSSVDLAALAATFGNEPAVKAYVDRLATP